MNKPTKEYSAMLYALADEIEKEEGCVTESHEAVREAAQRMDELTVTIRGMEVQQEGLLAALESGRSLIELISPFEGDVTRQMDKAIASVKGGWA